MLRTTSRSETPTRSRVAARLRQLDFYPKPIEDATVERTGLGACFTILCVLCLAWLLISSFASFYSRHTEDTLTVDTTRNQRLRINLNMTFPKLVCPDVAVDVVDTQTSQSIPDAAYQIVKERLDAKGVPLSVGFQKRLGKSEVEAFGEECVTCVSVVPEQMRARSPRFDRHNPRTRRNQECCNTCAQLRAYLRVNHVPQTFADTAPQCNIERPVQDGEGCRVYGYLEVPKVKGEFHIAAGEGSERSHEDHKHHVHSLDPFRLQKFDVTHLIHALSFGDEVPGMYNPLDGTTFETQYLAQKSYYIQVVPTLYKRESDGTLLTTNQYSYTQHTKLIQLDGFSFALPGVFFKYDVFPFMVQITEKKQHLSDFVTNVCAIVGGIYVVFGMVSRLFATATAPITKKFQKDK
eukprot:TRINITY_DN12414_c0_g1_i2.p1 TRINITY_DN12414_c0_g1~~TRINITY_DN12414_c0_g1_i2.p1  ORF type:complete len:414 (+),score=92.21 TRINITY_DN12414_c0_g1_i2:22-1242(+)